MRPEEITQLAQTLEDDQWSKYPRYPQQARYALRDERVRSLLAATNEDAALTGVVSLGYSFFLGLNAICFQFSAGSILAAPSNILALLDSRCRVVGVLEN